MSSAPPPEPPAPEPTPRPESPAAGHAAAGRTPTAGPTAAASPAAGNAAARRTLAAGPTSGGTPLAVALGAPRRPLSDLYHFLLTRPWSWLLLGVSAVYFAINGVFACLYLVVGGIENARPGSFVDAFFFSVQTMNTIGYGRMAPVGIGANLLVSLEAITGLVALAMVTGLVFAKFARPTARVAWSRVCLVTRRDGVPVLMFRVANERANQIAEAQIRVVLMKDDVTTEGESVRRILDLPLVRAHNAVFALSWTVVHPIDAASPLRGATPETLAHANVGIIASLTGLDETFAQTIHARKFWRAGDVRFGGRFVDVLRRTADGRVAVDYGHFHDVVDDTAPPAGGPPA